MMENAAKLMNQCQLIFAGTGGAAVGHGEYVILWPECQLIFAGTGGAATTVDRYDFGGRSVS